ncbi:hypothetical protein DFJ58DRAFT_124857 [Suillus subalutaceus]|uniref:uncharacterized protein n=1 Tax=Suillus subalutaceus TaxID=48586 RepID=UPI001B864598|nr:uncharacterized protein DFJ58DRAFT_124857 [Suillus subalutaceus]KAG1838525.1 hypothetical protein DFJ58DRAFT_124857 [Suillus subalutaceus]
MLGLSFTIFGYAYDGTSNVSSVFMFTAQIWNLCIALFIFACFFTFVALCRLHGSQSAAYSHVWTLTNLMDGWSPVMRWGHKEGGISYCHAGMSDHPLPDVKMDCVHAAKSVSLGLCKFETC